MDQSQPSEVALIGTSGREADAGVVVSCGCRCVELPAADAATRADLVLVNADEAWSESGALTKLRLGRAQAPVVLVASSETPTELVEAAVQAGIDDVILRPLKPAHLTERLQATRTAPAVPPRLPTRKGPRTVMLSCDEPELRARLSSLLGFDGYHVLDLHAGGPVEPLARKAGRIDLVLVVRLSSEAKPAELDALLTLAKSSSDRPVLCLLVGNAGASPPPAGVRLLPASTTPEELLAIASSSVDRPVASLRVAARVPFVCPVEFREVGGTVSGEWRSGFSVNASPGGIFVRTMIPARAGSALELKIHLSTTRELLTVTGVVAWSNPWPAAPPLAYPVGMGVQFLGAVSRKLRGLITAVESAR